MSKGKELDPYWNRCDLCGRFIAMYEFDEGKAIRYMTKPDSDYSCEEYETLCSDHAHLKLELKQP